MIKKLCSWLYSIDQSYEFVVYLLCAILLYATTSPMLSAWKTEIITLLLLVSTFIGAKLAIKSIKNMMVWLLITPLVFTLIFIASFSILFSDLATDFIFAVIIIVITTVVWALTAWIFNEEKTKIAMSILNDIFRYILVFSLLANWYQYPSIIVEAIKPFGMTPGSLIETSIKIVTLPYVLAGIAGTFILNLRQWKII